MAARARPQPARHGVRHDRDARRGGRRDRCARARPELSIRPGDRAVTRAPASAARSSARARTGRRAPRRGRAPDRRRRRAAAGSPLSRQSRTSSHVTGVDTVGRSRARSEYTQTVVLCSSFWLQSMKTLPLRSVLVHPRDDEVGLGGLEQLGDRMREALRVLVRDAGRVQRHVDLQPLGARRLRERLQAELLEHPLQPQRRRGSTRRSSPARPGRGRRPSSSGSSRPRRGAAACAARARRGSRARRASAGRCRRRTRRSSSTAARARSRPNRGGATGTASRRSSCRRRRWGSARASAAGPRGAAGSPARSRRSTRSRRAW